MPGATPVSLRLPDPAALAYRLSVAVIREDILPFSGRMFSSNKEVSAVD
jgi:hypothetical protein